MPNRGLTKITVPEQKKPSIPKKNTSMMPSFNPEEVFLLPEDVNNLRQPSAIPPKPISQPMAQPNVIRNASLQTLPDEPMQPEDDSSNFLASLIAQGVAGIGTGLMGGSPADIQRSAGIFESMRSQEASRNKAKLLMDPKSEESKKRREVFKKLGYNVPDNFSYTDLNDPTVLQALKGQMEQSRLAVMPRAGIGVSGAGKPKEEKESKDQKETDKFTSNTETIKKQLEEYRKAIKAIKSPYGYAAEKAKAESLANSLLLKIKTAEKTGALDTGSISIIQDITGSPDYTRDEVIDARINQALKNLNDNVENELRGTGTINKFYKPYISPEIQDEREKAIIQNYYSNPNDPDNLKMYQDLRTKKGF
jgi:hypothetical protein